MLVIRSIFIFLSINLGATTVFGQSSTGGFTFNPFNKLIKTQNILLNGIGEIPKCWHPPMKFRDDIPACPGTSINHNIIGAISAQQEKEDPVDHAVLLVNSLDDVTQSVGEPTKCADQELILDNLTDEIEDPENDSKCKKPKKCSTVAMTEGSHQRTKFDKHIIEAANEFGIHPALLKAQLHVETSMNPLTENQKEKDADKAGKLSGWKAKYRWGKGLGQFGANNAADYGLNWNAERPTAAQMEDEEFLKTLNTPTTNEDGDEVYSIWSPKGAILAKAKYLKERMDKQYKIKVRDAEGNPTGKEIRIDSLYKRNEVETARYLAGMYNRGIMPINSIEEHYRQTGKFPRYYGEAWDVRRTKGTPPYASKYEILYGEIKNRCHVYRIAGLCGEEAQGFFGEYSNDYQMFEDGSWQVAT